MTDTYGACPTKQKRRTRSEIDAVKAALVEILTAEHPMTVRQVFYQLVVRDVIEKTEAQYQKTVIRLLTEMRMSGEIKFSWINDGSRSRTTLSSFDSIADAISDTAKFYRRNAMRECPDYVEIWVEKQGLAGLIWDEAGEYGVPVVPSKGMPSLSLLYETATLIKRAWQARKPSYIYQFGDHDPTGVLIPKNLEERLGELCQKLGCPPPRVERVSLTVEQIEQYHLPTRPTKREGNSHANKFEGDSVELDALPPAALRGLIRDCVGNHISQQQWDALQVAEASERKILWDWADRIRDGAP